ncbi:MAG: aminotransferase class V-fold PLP-dependent enzyme [Ignavibacteriales bacterium]
MKTIYLDNAATSYPKPESVYRAVDHFNRHLGSNPGRGSSRTTLQAGSVLLEAREALAGLFNIADSSNIAFTLNVTEALNVGLKGLLKAGDHIITTSMEHNAVARPLAYLSQQGIEWTRIPCGSDGTLDPGDVIKAIRSNTRMICMLHASNLIGTIMPIREVGAIAHQHGLLFMVDSAQSAGVLPIDVIEQNIDILAFTGHKSLFGPQGTGGIYVRPGLIVNPLKQGGTGSLSEDLEQPIFMPDLLEAGTPNTPGIAGLLAGVRFITEEGLAKIRAHENALTEYLISGLKEIPGIKLYGPTDLEKRTAVVAFNIDGVDCGDLGLAMDYEYGITTRSGLHCAPLAHTTLGTLISGACRISPGYFNTEQDILQTIKAIHTIATKR